MKGPSLAAIRRYAGNKLAMKQYLERPGDGRVRPQIAARDLLWALIGTRIVRDVSFLAVEARVRSPAARGLEIKRAFCDDTLAYFVQRLDPAPSRAALVQAIRRAKRNKAFAKSRLIGLALDGSTAGSSTQARCGLCHPVRNQKKEITGHHHRFSMISVVGVGLTLPIDVEPYADGDCEYVASQRLLRRAHAALGSRFADYVIGDAAYATAPFLSTASELGLRAIARVKQNLPELAAAVETRFAGRRPSRKLVIAKDRVDIWDACDFDPWEGLPWKTVRVLRYHQHKPDGTVIKADWLTNFTKAEVPSEELFQLAKSRWEIENQGFNEAKNLFGLEHVCSHTEPSLLAVWLLTLLAMVIERLYRVRHLHRGSRPVPRAIDLARLLISALYSHALPPDDTG